MDLAKAVVATFKNLPDRLSEPVVLFLPKLLKIFNTISSDTKLNLNLELGNYRIFPLYCWTEGNRISKKGEGN